MLLCIVRDIDVIIESATYPMSYDVCVRLH